MSYTKKILLANETIYYETKNHWVIFLLPGSLAIASLCMFLLPSILKLLGYLGLMVALTYGVMSLTQYLTSEFAVTNKRVLIKLGFIKRQSWETLLQKIAGVEVEQTILGRLLGYGTIKILNTGGGKDIFTNIHQPLQFRREVQGQIEKEEPSVSTKPAGSVESGVARSAESPDSQARE